MGVWDADSTKGPSITVGETPGGGIGGDSGSSNPTSLLGGLTSLLGGLTSLLGGLGSST